MTRKAPNPSSSTPRTPALRFSLRRPCSECPFRRDSLPGWLGERRTRQLERELSTEGKSFSCHKTQDAPGGEQHCAGAARLMLESGTLSRALKTAQHFRLVDLEQYRAPAGQEDTCFPDWNALHAHHASPAPETPTPNGLTNRATSPVPKEHPMSSPTPDPGERPQLIQITTRNHAGGEDLTLLPPILAPSFEDALQQLEASLQDTVEHDLEDDLETAEALIDEIRASLEEARETGSWQDHWATPDNGFGGGNYEVAASITPLDTLLSNLG